MRTFLPPAHPKDGGRYCFQFVCQFTSWGDYPISGLSRGGTPSQLLMGVTPSQAWWGTPSRSWWGYLGYPKLGLDGGYLGYPPPLRPGQGTHPPWDGVPPPPSRPGQGTPHPGMGYPQPGMGYLPTWDGVQPRWGTPWDMVPPTIKTLLGYPPDLGWGTPH